MPTTTAVRLQELFVVGLHNAHALEKQALSIMTPQASRIEHYPELADRLQSHIEETHGSCSHCRAGRCCFERTRKSLGLRARSCSPVAVRYAWSSRLRPRRRSIPTPRPANKFTRHARAEHSFAEDTRATNKR
jgi:hypothetical protein